MLMHAKGKGSSSPRDGCFKCGGQSYAKGTQSKSWSKSEPSFSGKGKSKRKQGEIQRETLKEPKVRIKVPKAHTRAKHRKLVCQVLNT